MMIFDVPLSIVNFCSLFLPQLGEFAPTHIVEMLPVIFAAMASSASGRYSLSSLSKQVYGHVRHKSTLSRLLACREFRSRDLHWGLFGLVMTVLGKTVRGTVDWLLAIDATSLVRGAHTRIPGGIHPDRRQANRQRRKAGKIKANGRKDQVLHRADGVFDHPSRRADTPPAVHL